MNKKNLGLKLVMLYVLVVIVFVVFVNNLDVYYTLGSMVWWFGRFLYNYIPLGVYSLIIIFNLLQLLAIYYGGNYIQKLLKKS